MIEILFASCLFHKLPFIRWIRILLNSYIANIKSTNISYSTLSPSIITTNVSGYMVLQIVTAINLLVQSRYIIKSIWTTEMYIRCWILKFYINCKNFICLPAWSQPLTHHLNYWIIPSILLRKSLFQFIIFGMKKTKLLQKFEKGAIYSYKHYAIACHNYSVYSWLYT